MRSDIYNWNKDADTDMILDETERIGIFVGLKAREAATLRLLAEEMFGMTKGILAASENVPEWGASFYIENKNKDFTLYLNVKAYIASKAREEFLGVAKDGENASEKSLLGKLKGAFERVIYSLDNTSSSMILAESYVYGIDTSIMWSLSDYSDANSEQGDEWDGMEKSILIGASDNVTVGVSAHSAHLTVRKDFSK